MSHQLAIWFLFLEQLGKPQLILLGSTPPPKIDQTFGRDWLIDRYFKSTFQPKFVRGRRKGREGSYKVNQLARLHSRSIRTCKAESQLEFAFKRFEIYGWYFTDFSLNAEEINFADKEWYLLKWWSFCERHMTVTRWINNWACCPQKQLSFSG